MDSRRDNVKSDDSTLTTLSEGRNLRLDEITTAAQIRNLSVESLIANERRNKQEQSSFSVTKIECVSARDMEPMQILQRCLSLKSILTTHSSFAERMQELAKADPAKTLLNVIGQGTFGVVFEVPGTCHAIKKTLFDSQESRRQLQAEWELGCRASVSTAMTHEIFRNTEGMKDAEVPRVPCYKKVHCVLHSLAERDLWWQGNGERFPDLKEYRRASPLFIFERILPLPEMIRENLIKCFSAPEAQNQALLDPHNKDCLIRPYLGRRFEDLDQDQKKNHPPDGLRNFPLYLDQLSRFEQMEPRQLARSMALGLASGHWQVGIDMLDVEFVIGSRAEEISPYEPTAKAARAKKDLPSRFQKPVSDNDKVPDFHHRITQMWMLDFDKTKEFRLDGKNSSEGIKALVNATLANDPYYPDCHPKREEDWELWLDFRDTYVEASQVLIQQQHDAMVIQYPDDCNKALQVPRQVMNEWQKATGLGMGKSELKEWKARAKAEGWRMG